LSIDQPGLRIRLETEMRRIASQHQQLVALFEELRVALDGATRAPTSSPSAAFARYQQALLAHFSMEDRVAFPALHGLRPDLAPRIEALAAEHHALRAEIAEMGRSIGSQPTGSTAPNGAHAMLTTFGESLRHHESREEELVALVRASD